jgi:predicted dehydrogenase
MDEILDDPDVRLVTSAAIPDQRCALGLQVMQAGKDYFTDKSPFTTLTQLEQARAAVAATGKKYMVSYSERLGNESAWQAGELIKQGAIGRVLQVLNLAPHNLAAHSRPDWFFQKARYGGILTDIGSHQFEQFLAYTGATDGTINFARVENFGNPEYPGLEDFGEASLTLNTGASAYCRIDWFNPAGSRTWGDGRTFILGETGYMELRKYINVAKEDGGDKIYLVDGTTDCEIPCAGRVGFPFFGQLILDVLNRTELAMTQDHAFKAAELSLKAQAFADSARSAAK